MKDIVVFDGWISNRIAKAMLFCCIGDLDNSRQVERWKDSLGGCLYSFDEKRSTIHRCAITKQIAECVHLVVSRPARRR